MITDTSRSDKRARLETHQPAATFPAFAGAALIPGPIAWMCRRRLFCPKRSGARDGHGNIDLALFACASISYRLARADRTAAAGDGEFIGSDVDQAALRESAPRSAATAIIL